MTSTHSKHLPESVSIPYPKSPQLIQSYLSGDSLSLAKLIKLYSPFVSSVTGRILARYRRHRFMLENSDDITQNVLLKFPTILQNFQRYIGQVPFDQFLSSCIRHTVLDSLKSQLRREKHEILPISEKEEFFLEIPAPESPALTESQNIRQALGRLLHTHPVLGQIARDYYYTGFHDTEIGARHNLTKMQAWRTRQAALTELKSIIQK